jgi:DNA replication ATP-dependent helicase Dna2
VPEIFSSKTSGICDPSGLGPSCPVPARLLPTLVCRSADFGEAIVDRTKRPWINGLLGEPDLSVFVINRSSSVVYRLGKRAISQYIRTDCQRRLRLDLYSTAADRAAAGAPERDAARPGFALITQAGRNHERQRFAEMSEVLPNLVVHGGPTAFTEGEERAFGTILLRDHLPRAIPNQLLIEAEYQVIPAFVAAHGMGDLADGSAFNGTNHLAFSAVRPDIIHVVPPGGARRRAISIDGRITPVADDTRFGLRVIDVKISGEASPAHFSELAYYGMTLAGWLEANGLSDRFFVLAEAAIWPGRHDASSIEAQLREDVKNHVTQRDQDKYLTALSADLETMPPEVVLGRVARFLRNDLRMILTEPDWRNLPWHVDHRCSGCDYLGYKWSTEEDAAAAIPTPPERTSQQQSPYCWTMAKDQDHPSRVAGLTEGARGKLLEGGISSVVSLSAASAGNAVFETHQTLRAKRTVLVARGQTLVNSLPAAIPDRAGTSAVLPSFSDIRVNISADFDVGSGLTFAFGYNIAYGVPNAPRTANTGYGRAFSNRDRALLVMERSAHAEGEILRQWLEFMMQDIARARTDTLAGYRQFDQNKRDVTIQFYIWDRLVFNHLCRIMGRHLDIVQAPVRMGGIDVSPMSWLFPAETVLEDARFTSVSSPLTIVSEIVNSLVAAPVPHHYGLVSLANDLDADRRIRADGSTWAFNVNKFYLDPLSDQIPSERGSEIWQRKSPFRSQDFQWHQEQTRRVVRDKLRALSWIVDGLSRRLRDTLSAEAPTVGEIFRPEQPLTGVGFDGQMLYQHTRLMQAAQKLENDLLLATPPHEREARFMSARVDRTLVDNERAACLRQYGLGALVANPSVYAFELRDASREVRMKDGDFLLSFAPEDLLVQVQHETAAGFKTLYPALQQSLPIQGGDYQASARASLRVSVRKIDRANRRLIIQASTLLQEAVRLGIASLDFNPRQGRFGVVDPVVLDFFSRRLRDALSGRTGQWSSPGVRNPPLAVSRPLFHARIANVGRLNPRASASVPAETFIWNADVAASTATGLSATEVVAIARTLSPDITPKQSEAIERSVQRQLAIWWGPPGTGKSATAQAYLASSLKHAADTGAGLRIAVTGFTWVAIDHVAKKLPELLARLGIADRVRMVRLASGAGSNDSVAPELQQFILPMNDFRAPDRQDLENDLAARDSLVLVASTVEQIAKLGGSVIAPLFDLMLIDEASQVDVAHAVVGFTKLAPSARVTVVGDDLQMAPIHPIEPPVGAEYLVGSIFDFYRHYRRRGQADPGIDRIMLDRSFRSNSEIVDFVRLAGYQDLHASDGSKDLRFATQIALSATAPASWRAGLTWSPAYAAILNPEKPLTAVVHNDRFSSQRNQEEADLVSGLVLALFESRLMDIDAGNAAPLSPVDFFRNGVGIVTPHRAQQAAVFERLAAELAGRVDANEIFAAVDTVERFQGQEKTVMIASFGLGDKDQIAAEETFLFQLNRFNVTASRAKAKFIAIMSRRLLDHLPTDKEALHQSRLIKHFADGFLQRSAPISLPGLGECELRTR